jgi:hypothetical protein
MRQDADRRLGLIVMPLVLGLAVLALSGCGGRTYEVAPDSVLGKWKSVDGDPIARMIVAPERILVVDVDGTVERCDVRKVTVRYELFGEGKTVKVHCRVDSPDALAKASKCKKYPKPMSWFISLDLSDSEFNDQLYATSEMDLHCEDVTHPVLLGEFFKSH